MSSNGQAVTQGRAGTAHIAFANLDGDAGDDEIRGVITLTPQLPVAVARESDAVVVVAP